MNLIDRATVIHFHRHRIAEFGADSVRALGWVSEASQTRFGVDAVRGHDAVRGPTRFGVRSCLLPTIPLMSHPCAQGMQRFDAQVLAYCLTHPPNQPVAM